LCVCCLCYCCCCWQPNKHHELEHTHTHTRSHGKLLDCTTVSFLVPISLLVSVFHCTAMISLNLCIFLDIFRESPINDLFWGECTRGSPKKRESARRERLPFWQQTETTTHQANERYTTASDEQTWQRQVPIATERRKRKTESRNLKSRQSAGSAVLHRKKMNRITILKLVN